MKRDVAIQRLRGMEPELREQGVDHLYLFGSVARGDAGPRSDIDLAFDVQLEAELKFSLIDQSRIMRQLSSALSAKVDFVERAYLRPRLAENVAVDMIQVF